MQSSTEYLIVIKYPSNWHESLQICKQSSHAVEGRSRKHLEYGWNPSGQSNWDLLNKTTRPFRNKFAINLKLNSLSLCPSPLVINYWNTTVQQLHGACSLPLCAFRLCRKSSASQAAGGGWTRRCRLRFFKAINDKIIITINGHVVGFAPHGLNWDLF